MTLDRIKLCAIAAAVATTLTGEVFAQPTGSKAAVQASPPAATQPGAAKGLSAGASGAGATTANPNGSAITGGVPGISGVTPNRAELSSSAFTKLDAGSRGYVTADDVRQLEGFESAFRQADQNGDGRLNASEFNAAWSAYTGNTR